MRDDCEMLRLYAAQRSNEAFSELVQRHLGTVYSVAFRRTGGDVHLAEEIAQEVFIDLARKAESLCRRETLVGWLFVATRFAAAKAVRRDQQQRMLRQKVEQMKEERFESSGEPAWEELRPVLDGLIHRLAERDREAVLLHFFEKRTFAEIGATLHITESGARMRVDRALEKLRVALTRRGVTSTSAALASALGGQAVAAVPPSLAATVTTSALAAAVPATGAGTIILMAMTKTKLAVALSVVLAGATATAVLQERRISTLVNEQATIRSELAGNAGRIAELKAKLATAESTVAALSRDKSEHAAVGPKPTAESATRGEKVIHLRDVIKEHPEMAALEQKEMRRSMLRMYGRAIAALNFTDVQSRELKKLLVERNQISSDVQDAARQAGLNSGDAGKAYAQAYEDLNQSIKTLIGADALEKMEALAAVANEAKYGGNEGYAIDMEEAGVPISEDKTLTLASLRRELRDPKKNPDAGSAKFREPDPKTWMSPSDQQFLSKAEAILTPEQLGILESSISEFNHRNAILRPYLSNNIGEPVVITN